MREKAPARENRDFRHLDRVKGRPRQEAKHPLAAAPPPLLRGPRLREGHFEEPRGCGHIGRRAGKRLSRFLKGSCQTERNGN